jgi:proteasome assembly chaperone (PAC2) family protein
VKLNNPWLIATWPGMGGVGLLAGTYLVEKLGAERHSEVGPGTYFEAISVNVKDGVLYPPIRPKNTFYAWRDPSGRRDLLILIGEAQPSRCSYEFCEEVLEIAKGLGVTRVITFAAMATPIHPSSDPRVFAVASDKVLLEELNNHAITVLDNGEISGLNGLIIGVAATRDVAGVCLLGEFPYFASSLPCPKPAAAILRKLSAWAEIEIDMGEIDSKALESDAHLAELFDRIHAAQSHGQTHADEPAEEAPREVLSQDLMRRLDEMFEAAKTDRAKATELKAELDKHGLFKRFEDRFLDLFRSGSS